MYLNNCIYVDHMHGVLVLVHYMVLNVQLIFQLQYFNYIVLFIKLF